MSRRFAANLWLVDQLESRLLLSSAIFARPHFGRNREHFSQRQARYRVPPAPAQSLSASLSSPAVLSYSATPATAAPLVPPTLTLSSADSLEVRLSATAATGGSGVYHYQWHRGTSAGFVPSADNAVAGANALALTDASAQAGIPYFYILEASDSASTVFSNQAVGALLIPTTPINLPYQSGPVVLGYIGSSTWAINQGSGQVPTKVGQNLHTAFPSASITTVNGAVSGTRTRDYLPGQPLNNSVKAAMQAASGYKVLRLMIGSNDAADGSPAATWQANMQSIINDALTWPVDKIVLEEIGVRLDRGNGTLDLIRQYNAARSNLLTLGSGKVVLGTAYTFENQADHPPWLSGDRVHQTDTGQLDLAANQATELASLFTVPASQPLTFSAPTTDDVGTQIQVKISEPACKPGTGTSGFTLSGTSATVAFWTVSDTTLTLFLDNRVFRGQSVTLSAAAGVLQTAAGTPMNALDSLVVDNQSQVGPIRSGLRVQLP